MHAFAGTTTMGPTAPPVLTPFPNRRLCSVHPIDLVFLVDGSDSISSSNFEVVRDWVLSIVESFLNKRRSLGVAVVQFSEESKVEVDYRTVRNVYEIRGSLVRMTQLRMGTNPYTALRLINSEIVQQLTPTAFKVLITLTDGTMNEDRDTEAVETARSAFHNMMSVTVGEYENHDVSDFTKDGFNFDLDNFEDLQDTIAQITQSVCSQIDKMYQVG